MKTINLSTGSSDQQNTFNVLVTVRLRNVETTKEKVCSLMRDYEVAGDGIYWAMSSGACLKSEYSDADRDEDARLDRETAIKHGDVVMIEGEKYQVHVLGDYSNVAVFNKRQLIIDADHLEALGMDLKFNEAKERAESRARVAAYCKGFISQYQVTTPLNVVLVERFYAVLPDGRVFRSDEHDAPNSDFNLPHYKWEYLSNVTLDNLKQTPSLEYCGSYTVPEQCLVIDEHEELQDETDAQEMESYRALGDDY